MNQKMGMDLGAVRAKRDEMQAQISALMDIASQLNTTNRAAQNPAAFGIEPGEKTVSPMTTCFVGQASNELNRARTAATELFNTLNGEANAQELASMNDTFDSAKWWRSWATIPRNLLSGGAAFRAVLTNPAGSWAAASGGPFSRAAYDAGGAFLKSSAAGARLPIRGAFNAASYTKPGDIADKLSKLSRFDNGIGWVGKSKPLLENATKVLKTGTFVASKAFGVLGAGFGIYNIVEGAKNGDGWQLADGIVGTVTSLGSLAPPPVGVAFAAVGAAYTAGRWLFGEDENGQTGIDKIATGVKEFGNFVGDVAKNAAAGREVMLNAAADAGKDLAAGAAKILSGKWPW